MVVDEDNKNVFLSDRSWSKHESTRHRSINPANADGSLPIFLLYSCHFVTYFNAWILVLLEDFIYTSQVITLNEPRLKILAHVSLNVLNVVHFPLRVLYYIQMAQKLYFIILQWTQEKKGFKWGHWIELEVKWTTPWTKREPRPCI